MLDELVEVIKTLQTRIKDHGDTLRENETRTRMALIDPLLQVLGWDTADPGTVTPEYKVSGQLADYALLHGPGSHPAATIEAKKLGEALNSHRMQMLNYSNAAGVQHAGLTDGDRWELYEVFRNAHLDDRRILDVSIANDPPHQTALKMLVLWRPNLASEELTTANESIVDLLPPTGDPPQSTRPEELKPPSEPKNADPSKGWIPILDAVPTRDGGDKAPPRIRFSDGEEHEIYAWRDIPIRTAEWLCDKHLLSTDKVPVSFDRTHHIVSTDGKHPTGEVFKLPHPVPGTSLILETRVKPPRAVKNAVKLLEVCNQDPSQVYVRLSK